MSEEFAHLRRSCLESALECAEEARVARRWARKWAVIYWLVAGVLVLLALVSSGAEAAGLGMVAGSLTVLAFWPLSYGRKASDRWLRLRQEALDYLDELRTLQREGGL